MTYVLTINHQAEPTFRYSVAIQQIDPDNDALASDGDAYVDRWDVANKMAAKGMPPQRETRSRPALNSTPSVSLQDAHFVNNNNAQTNLVWALLLSRSSKSC